MFPVRWFRERKYRYLWCVQAIRILFASRLTDPHVRVTVLSAYLSPHNLCVLPYYRLCVRRRAV